MAKQYPHFLYVKVMGGNSTRDDAGNWIAAGEEFMFHTICREETNGKGHVINGQDGKSIIYSSIVYMPKSVARLKEGAEIAIYESKDTNSVCLIRKQVLKFDAGQLGCRLWV